MERLTYRDTDDGIAELKDFKYDSCQDLCDKVDGFCLNCHIQKVIEKLAKYEDAEEQGLLFPKWIPCSERLPETYKKVLITYRRMVDGGITVATARRMEDGWKILFGGYCDSQCVIAWQPLPEPYKAEQALKGGAV